MQETTEDIIVQGCEDAERAVLHFEFERSFYRDIFTISQITNNETKNVVARKLVITLGKVIISLV